MAARVALVLSAISIAAGIAVLAVPTAWVQFLEYVSVKQIIFGFLLIVSGTLFANVWYVWRLEFPVRLMTAVAATCTATGAAMVAIKRFIPTRAKLDFNANDRPVFEVSFEQLDWVAVVGLLGCFGLALLATFGAVGCYYYSRDSMAHVVKSPVTP